VDCATFWLTNRMLGGWDVDEAAEGLCSALAQVAPPVVIVTNDVSGGVVPDNALARAFRGAQGRLNQRLAAEAGLVVQVTAGLPLVLKGEAGAIAGWDGGSGGARTW
ncbi:MAG: bifunctional adenosylcobinamide kinase/adenosylcobinamide-phosphate guanylyltransferase, partial [Roseicyclus sp.]